AAGHGPDPYRRVRAGRGQALAGGVEGQAINVAAVPGERLDQLAGGCVPQADDACSHFPARVGGEVAAVRAELHTVYLTRIGLEGQRFGARGDVPALDLTPRTADGAGEAATVRAKRHSENRPLDPRI